MPILALRLLLGRGLSAIWAWLSHRSFWRLVSMALCALLLVQHFALASEKRHSAKVEKQLQAATAELQRISSKRNEQKQVTQQNIKTVVRTIHDADERAKKIESAKLPGECRTPSEVLQADI